MNTQHYGRQSIKFLNKPVLTNWACVAGKKEGEGPLSYYYDLTLKDTRWGEKTWEQAESKMQEDTIRILCEKAAIKQNDIEILLSGDLLNQCIGSAFAARKTNIPHLGLYGACSTMAESMILAGILISGGFFNKVVAMTSSHFAASERQYRFPLGYGGQRPPTSQWTVTGAGAVLLEKNGNGPILESCTIGKVTDLGIVDANNMGCAMAPAALNTIKAHLNELSLSADYYDLIVTGDLGQIGKEALEALALQEGIPISGRLVDCGTEVFDAKTQDVHAGGSGCGCSAITLCGYYLNKIKDKKLKRILFCGTGALLSPTSTQQGLPIPSICHAIAISGGI